MIPSRESIMSALTTLLVNTEFSQPVNGSSTFRTVDRRLKLWGDCPKVDRPALYITDHGESTIYKTENTPGLTTMRVELFIYIDSSDNVYSIPSVDLNVILDAVSAAVAPSQYYEQRQTLGGLVSHCRIEGEILKDPGDLDGDGLLMIPILIMAT